MHTNPLVTVCIPAYNHERYIEESINSVINQTYKNIELIIINDGSTDNTNLIIEQLKSKCKKRFTNFVYINQKNMGISYTLQKMLTIATGEYFTITASDDTQKITRIAKFVAFLLKNSNCNFCYSGYEDIDENGNTISIKTPLREIYTFQDILFGNYNISFLSYIVKTSHLFNSGGYKKEIKLEDWELALRLTINGETIKFLQTPLYKHRIHKTNTHTIPGWLKEERLKVIEYYKTHKLYKKAKKLWEEHYLRLNHSSFFSKTYDKIIELGEQKKSIIIYGHGTFGKIIEKLIPNSVICFVDSASNNISKNIVKNDVYALENIKKINYDYILISVLGRENVVIDLLVTKFDIPKSKILML